MSPAAAAPGGESAADLLARKRPRTVDFTLVMDDDTGETVTFRFVAMGRTEFRDFLLDPVNQPTPAQVAEHRRLQRERKVPKHLQEPLDNNPDEFPRRYLARVCESHRMTPDEWGEFLDTLNDAEHRDLLGAALSAQGTRGRVDPEV